MILLSSLLPTARGSDEPFPLLLRPAVPRVERDWPRNPIDAFVLRAQREAGLSPSPEADRATLIRRVTFDLIGLPPTLPEIDAFESDPRPDAYERLVDRLLASPTFGERWATPWLDLVRHADSSGFEEDTRRPTAWRYRDWVVDALNADLPYDRFLQYQLAADELAPDEPRHLAALGFLRAGPTVGNERTERARLDELDDVVSTTASAFLGLTVGCARCHDHKADPIPTEDYYRLLAVFDPSKPAEIPLATRDEVARHRALNAEADAKAEPIRRELIALKRGRASTDLPPAERSALDAIQARIDAIDAARPAPLPTAPGVVESGPRPNPTHVLIRGEADRKGSVVEPGPPRALTGEVVDFPEPSRRARSSLRRSSLALWMTDRSNPLTARVIVNRIWQGHFGEGLVRTPSDFGANGDPAALPDGLDWLASELVERGWSLKAIHRAIVTSAVYRQSSRIRPEVRERDPRDTLLTRFPLRRLDAEMIRDAVLATSGSLNPARGGPGVFPPVAPSLIRTGNIPRWPLDAVDGPPVWRRSLYLFRLRSLPDPFLEVFDLPDPARSCPQRSRTTLPTQSLTLQNNPFLRTQAGRFAARVAREAGDSEASRVDLAFRLATGRPPSEAQRSAALAFLRSPESRKSHAAALTELALALYNSNAFLYLD